MKYLVAIGLFLIGVVTGWAGALFWLHPPTDSSSSASWVQAIGSIVAVGVAFGVVYTQKHFDKEAADNDLDVKRRKANELAMLLMKNAHEASTELAMVVEMNFMSGEMRSNAIDVLIDRRNRFDILVWENLGEAQAKLAEQARKGMTKLISISRKRPAGRMVGDDHHEAISEVNNVTRELQRYLDEFQAATAD